MKKGGGLGLGLAISVNTHQVMIAASYFFDTTWRTFDTITETWDKV